MPARISFYALVMIAVLTGVGVLALTPGQRLNAKPVTEDSTQGMEIRPFVKGSLASIVDSRGGRPFLTVFWSTYCASCLAEMDVWRELLQEREDFDIVMIATNKIDDADRLEGVLRERGLAGVEAWAFADPIPARLRADVDRSWRGALPYIRLYGRGGNFTARTGGLHKHEVEIWLDAQSG